MLWSWFLNWSYYLSQGSREWESTKNFAFKSLKWNSESVKKERTLKNHKYWGLGRAIWLLYKKKQLFELKKSVDMLETNTFMQNRQRKIVLTIWMCLMTDRLLECPCRKNKVSEQDNQVRFFLLNDVANEETTFFQTTDVIFLSWYGSGVSQREFI